MCKKFFYNVFLIFIFSLCAIGYSACDKEEIVEDNFAAWRDSALAVDCNGDRRITEEDYEIYKGYDNWKISEKAYDYNGDKKINYDDYLFSINPTNADFAIWLNSEKAYDYDGNGITDEKDFVVYNNYKHIIGKFKITNYNYQQTAGKTILLNKDYNLINLAQDIADFDFEIAKDLKLTCTYGDMVKQKLGDDEVAVQNAINSCAFDKLSDTVTTVSFTIQGLPFTVYLTKTASGFSSRVSVTIDNVTANISFDITYVE